MPERSVMNARIAVSRDITENWEEYPNFIPARGEVIVYEDYKTVDDGSGGALNVPGIKIGDGETVLGSLPFIDASARYDLLNVINTHTGNSVIHVTQADKNTWNAKLNYKIIGNTLQFVTTGNVEGS